jgi:adenomatosis polyposis coli protein
VRLIVGGLQAVAELLQLDNDTCGPETVDLYSVTLRRYACMVLTNLTYGDVENKSLLCSLPHAVAAIVTQLRSPDEDLRQVVA